MIASRRADAERDAAGTRAERVADVAGRAHVGHRPHPRLAREHRDPVDLARRPRRGLDARQHGQHRHERARTSRSAARPGRAPPRAASATTHSRLAPTDVGEPAERDRQRQADPGRHRHAQADLGAAEPDDLGEEDRRAGEERAGRERRQHALQGQVALELGLRQDARSAHPRRHSHIDAGRAGRAPASPGRDHREPVAPGPTEDRCETDAAATRLVAATSPRLDQRWWRSVGEVPGAGEVHRHAGRLGRLDGEVVAHRPARLDDRGDAGVDQDLRAVLEREEGVGGGDRADRRAPPPARRRACRSRRG